ncbi:MAG: hypothetical protein Unbinned175contig1000_2 [Prokaryotic dsDNA virus sp.]|nr:MAG: hypothetical protein Unbinned175contig1000_2 [Prokaryotic dsDNA virus sp.]|tara:strand:- start:27 stop:608 length:582 start_codon:yes stop_codon:yes gene_type:complete
MENTLLISEAKLKRFTDINNNLDVDLISSVIREAQIIHITRLLGSKLYDKLISDVDSDSLAGDYKTLVDDYVQDSLLYWAYYESLETIYLRPRNAGLVKPTGGENNIDADIALYDKKRQSVKNKAEYFSERLVDYLCFNSTLFPEYGTETNDDIFPDTDTQFKSPIVFRGGVRSDLEAMGIKVTNSRYKYLPQ